MAEISTIIEEAQMMEQNRVDLVKALNDVGFTQVNDSTPLSDIAKYIKWAGGLLDIRLACLSKSTKEQKFFTREEWDSLSAISKSSYIKLGVCLRAERQEFIIAKSDATMPDGSKGIKWSTANTDVRGLTNFVGSPDLLRDIDGRANTDIILASADYDGVEYPAAERARAYKASTVADGGMDDPTEWSLPAIGQLALLYKYYNELNAELRYYGLNPITDTWYWSSTEYGSSYAWYVYMSLGGINYFFSKSNAGYVRAVAPAIKTL